MPSAALHQALGMELRAARSSYRTEIHPTLADRLPSPTQNTRLQEDTKNNNKIPIPQCKPQEIIPASLQTPQTHSSITKHLPHPGASTPFQGHKPQQNSPEAPQGPTPPAGLCCHSQDGCRRALLAQQCSLAG